MFQFEKTSQLNMSDLQTNSLDHLVYKCPGLYGKDSKQIILRKTFRQLLKETNGRLIIPLFQRRYCWNEKTVSQWFDDVVRGQRDIHGTHNTGNVIVKRDSENPEDFIIIDGQQRITTTVILLATLSKVARRVLKIETADKLLKEAICELDQWIFLGPTRPENKSLVLGQDLKSSRLLPSFYDRRPLFQLLLNVQEGDDGKSHQLAAERVFMDKINREIEKNQHSRASELIYNLIRQSLDLMGVMLVEIVNDINMAQVFLWLQEKSLFGEASLLYNPTPGVYFTAVDMARNLLLSPMMSESIADQERFYRQNWLEPIESCFATSAVFNLALSEFIKLKCVDLTHESESEKAYVQYSNAATASLSSQSRENIRTYAKLCSVLEQTSVKNCGPEQQRNGATSKEASIRFMQEFSKFSMNFTPI